MKKINKKGSKGIIIIFVIVILIFTISLIIHKPNNQGLNTENVNNSKTIIKEKKLENENLINSIKKEKIERVSDLEKTRILEVDGKKVEVDVLNRVVSVDDKRFTRKITLEEYLKSN